MLRALFSPAMILYVLTILVLNLGFSYVPMISTTFGMLSPMALVAGLVFVMRDFAQRESGHLVLVGMLVAAVLTFVMADPFVALASVVAFGTSELIDYLLYTITKKPFHQRVWRSSLISTPVDTLVFLTMISGLTAGTFVLMVLAKLVAAAAILFWYRASPSVEQYA